MKELKISKYKLEKIEFHADYKMNGEFAGFANIQLQDLTMEQCDSIEESILKPEPLKLIIESGDDDKTDMIVLLVDKECQLLGKSAEPNDIRVVRERFEMCFNHSYTIDINVLSKNIVPWQPKCVAKDESNI